MRTPRRVTAVAAVGIADPAGRRGLARLHASEEWRIALGLKRGGAEIEFGEAFRLFAPWLERRLLGRGLRAADAADIVQESFLRFCRYGGAVRARHPRALLLRIASNLAIDAARRHSVRGGDRTVGTEALEGLPDASPDAAFLIDLKLAVMDLPPKLRDAFLLARFTPMTNEEVAAHLGISTKTVEWRISRAVSICLARLER